MLAAIGNSSTDQPSTHTCFYADNGQFECNKCYSQRTSIIISVLAWLANFLLVALSTYFIFMSDYTEEMDISLSDLFKVGASTTQTL